MGRWLGAAQLRAGYDRVAPSYDAAWLCRLQDTTDELLGRLRAGVPGRIIDLGSGTGYSARRLARDNPGASVIAVDLSPEMLNRARAQAPANMTCVVADMLDFVRREKVGGTDLVVSTWAMGYSQISKLFCECSRVLPTGGKLAFVVNYSDTLAPVFRAFRRCMIRFPGRVCLAAHPRFPKDWGFLEKMLTRCGFAVEWHQDRRLKITPPSGDVLPWLRQTGVLAGFDAMLDLSGEAGTFVEEQLKLERENLFHHCAMVIACKT